MASRRGGRDRSVRRRSGLRDRVLRFLFVASALLAIATFGWLRYERYTSGNRVPRSLVQAAMSGGQPLGEQALPGSARIIVYSNYQCHYCSAWADSIEMLLSSNPRVDIRVKHLATPAFSPGSFEGAMAAECAAEQGRFPAYHRALFVEQRFSRAALIELGSEVGIPDSDSFAQCIGDERYKDLVLKQAEEAELLKIRGTPATIVRQRILTGVRPVVDVKRRGGW